MNEEKLYDAWSRRKPNFEKHFGTSLLRTYADYGKKYSESVEYKGKAFGPAYELYIYAFFLGLYSGHQKDLEGESTNFSYEIENWGNSSPIGRKSYPNLKKYIFIALVAKTEKLDLIALDKGEITVKKAVDYLIETMEKYTNYGFYLMLDKQEDKPDYFYRNTGFLNMILEFTEKKDNKDEELEDL